MPVARRFVLILVFLCAGAAPGIKAAGSEQPEDSNPPNIILITLDTTRADRMGFLGSKRGLTPNLDELAKQSVVFTRAYAQVPLTSPSHAALLTGTYPQFNHLRDLGEPLREDLPYIPELLHQHGYHTGAFLGAMILDPTSGAAPGFDRGFDVYDSRFHNPAPGESRYQSLERRAEEVGDLGMGWLSHNHDGPFFLWLHFYDPHDPYDPPEPFKSQYASAPYDGEIAYMDSIVGRTMTVLKRHGLFENTLIAIAADHGEAFGEHGEQRHGLLLYDETIHVPLLLKLPGERMAGKRVDTRVALTEVAPTVLDVAGIAVPPTMQAKSLTGLMQEANAVVPGKGDERAVYSESDYAHRTFGWSELHSWRAGKYLYVQAPKKELYDQLSDPGALRNLASTAHAVAGTLDAQLSSFREKTSSDQTEKQKFDPGQSQTLQALGYLGSVNVVSKQNEKPLVDPKDKGRIVSILQNGLSELEAGHNEQALEALHEVVRDPDAVNAYLEFGMAFARHDRLKEAVPLLQAAAKKLPDSVVARYEYAKALVNSGQWAAALPEMKAASALKPDSAHLHFFVASVHGHLNQIPEAMAEYDEALKIDPNFFEANLTYGRLLLRLGQLEKALPKLNQAAAVKADAPEPHLLLADAYEKLGRAKDASEERAKATQLKSQPPE